LAIQNIMCIIHITFGKYKKTNDTDVVEKEDKNVSDEKYNIYRENNHVYFHAEVDGKTIQKLLCEMRGAQEYCTTTKNQLNVSEIPIYLHINSLGGELTPAFVAIDFIRGCKTPIYSIVEGECASAASLMSIVCDKRFIRPNAYMMIHQMSCQTTWGKLYEVTSMYNYFVDIEKRLKKIYIKNTRVPPEKLEEIWIKDKWLNAKKCMKYGLVDEFTT